MDAATIAFAHRLADTAGAVIRPYFRQRIDVADKKPVVAGKTVFDPVTAADRDAEEAIRALIERERPNDGILGEEFGEKKSASGRRWVLDPVDGTRSFIAGRHEWGSLIALEEDGRAVLGIIDQPVLGERFLGVNGECRFRARERDELAVRVRECSRLEDAILCATHPDAFYGPGERDAFRRVQKCVRMTRWGGDCYIFGAMALGFVDLIVETAFHRWDVAALIPVIEGAGGIITNWQGGDCSEGGQTLAAGDRRIHAAALKALAG
ncbi:MAG: histidinol-phosphatase [Proteobacteria bacterium]|nr:histidinol-phosphatase [Pseudomonadota bacterium]